MAKTINLRDWQPSDSDAKNVMDTKSLATTAHETQDTVDDSNVLKERVVDHPSFGKLGAKGRE